LISVISNRGRGVFLFLPKRAATGLSRAAIGASSDIIASIDISDIK